MSWHGPRKRHADAGREPRACDRRRPGRPASDSNASVDGGLLASASTKSGPTTPARAWCGWRRTSWRTTLESYRTDHIDGENIEALFDLPELEEGLAFRRSMPSDLMSLLREWTQGFCPLSTIERALSDLIDARGSDSVERVSTALTAEDAMEMLAPGDILVDCTGSRSLLRDHLEPYAGAAVEGANTAQLPARVRDRRHLPVRRPLRLQRALQVLQERREPGVQVHPGGRPDLLRRRRQPRDRHRRHQRRGVRRDAGEVRRRTGCAASSRTSRRRWIASSTRSGRRRRATWSATSRSCGYR